MLANEQVLADGTCERSGDVVERRNLEQWFFRITKYADELLDALDGLDWPERVKTMQRNWIGRSEGAQIPHWPSTGATGPRDRGLHDPPGHRLRHDLRRARARAPARRRARRPTEQAAAVEALRSRVLARIPTSSAISTEGPLDKRGAFTGQLLPSTRSTASRCPIYVADYVLMGYGTGAIMAVPAEDERDFAFADAYGLPVVRTVEPPEGFEGGAYSGDGRKINSGFLDGLDVADREAAARSSGSKSQRPSANGPCNTGCATG